MKTPQINSIGRSPLRRGFLLIPLAIGLAWFALAPAARAVCQDGCDLINGNTFLGDDALLNNTGLYNTAIGSAALSSNTTGGTNTAIGNNALQSNTIGSNNTAIGLEALRYNTRGGSNTATGVNALISNLMGSSNTANGIQALFSNRNGSSNTAVGANALFRNKASHNSATGQEALLNNTFGDNNIALGFQAGLNLTTGNNNIDIGNAGVAAEANTIRIGTQGTQTATFIAGITGTAVVGDPVVVDGNGQLGTGTSSVRFKKDIKPMDKTSEAVLALRPVRFQYKSDSKGTLQFGLIAEEVAKVNSDLVARDEQGKPYSVRYEAVNAMLLNEFLKAHRKMEEQDATIAKQQKQIEALTAAVQKVTAQVELSKPAPQIVLNNQ